MHVALGYQYPSHMLQLMLVAAFCHLRLTLKETTPLPLLSPHPSSPPLLSPPQKTKRNKHKNYKSKKAIFLLAFWWWLGGGGVGKYSLWRFNCKILCFFFSIYLFQSAAPKPKPSEGPSKYKFFYFIKRQKPASDF